MNFTKDELAIVVEICERAEGLGIAPAERINLIMDLDNTHASTGLNLTGLLEADDLNFAHDVVGIQQHMNRRTKELDDFFVPRYAQQKDFDIDSVIDKAQASAEKHNNALSAEKHGTEKDLIK